MNSPVWGANKARAGEGEGNGGEGKRRRIKQEQEKGKRMEERERGWEQVIEKGKLFDVGGEIDVGGG